jgi:endonuclease-8
MNSVTELPHPYNKIGDGPEGPEVAVIADGLKAIMEGKMLNLIVFTESTKHERLDEIVLPQRITEVKSYGKKIIFTLESGTVIVNSLLMSGGWTLESNDYVKFTFLLEDHLEVHYTSTRNLAKTIVLFDDEEKKKFYKKLGPDLLKEDIAKEVYIERMRAMTKKRKGSKPFLLCDALLEQKIFVGLGNYLRADVMYDAKLPPDINVQELTDEQLEKLYISTIKIIRKSYQAQGFNNGIS